MDDASPPYSLPAAPAISLSAFIIVYSKVMVSAITGAFQKQDIETTKQDIGTEFPYSNILKAAGLRENPFLTQKSSFLPLALIQFLAGVRQRHCWVSSLPPPRSCCGSCCPRESSALSAEWEKGDIGLPCLSTNLLF